MVNIAFKLAVGFVAQRIFCVRRMMGNDGQPAVLDKKRFPFGIQISLGFTIAMAVLADLGVIHRHPFFAIQLRAAKFLLPHQLV